MNTRMTSYLLMAALICGAPQMSFADDCPVDQAPYALTQGDAVKLNAKLAWSNLALLELNKDKVLVDADAPSIGASALIASIPIAVAKIVASTAAGNAPGGTQVLAGSKRWSRTITLSKKEYRVIAGTALSRNVRSLRTGQRLLKMSLAGGLTAIALIGGVRSILHVLGDPRELDQSRSALETSIAGIELDLARGYSCRSVAF